MQIVKYPHPTLRHKSKPLRRVDHELRSIVEQMFAQMYEHGGVGLAANQVDLPYRLFILNTESDPAAKDAEFVFINPVITQRKGIIEREEGCLSFPEIYAPVRRSEKVSLTAYNLAGEEVTYELEALLARAAQHELDHLDGILFIDRLTPANRLAIKEALEDLEREFAGDRSRGLIPAEDLMAARLAQLEAPAHVKPMRLAMLATGPFALPTFDALYQSPHEVVGLVTGPLRPQHMPHPPPLNPLRATAAEHGTAVLDPEDVNDPESRIRLAAWQADLLVVCDYGQILAPQTLAAAWLGGINLHASLLPKYRGAAPINWAIYHGERETGVTVIQMTPQLDAGPCIGQSRLQIGPDETAPQLEARLAQLGAALVRQTIDALQHGAATALPQEPALASRAPRLKKTDGLIDWQRPAEALRNQVRAMEPWPRCSTYLRRAQGQPLRLILGPVTAIAQPTAAPPGTVLEAAGDQLVVAAGQGALVLSSVQPAGKRMLSVAEFLRGYHAQPGDSFGSG